MRFCSTFGHMNDQTALYCESCGNILDTDSSTSNATERSAGYEVAGLTPPPPPPSYTTQSNPSGLTDSAESSYYTQPLSPPRTPALERPIDARPAYWDEALAESQRPKRTTGRLIIDSILYLYGILCSAFGASGLLLQGTASALIGTVFLGYCLAGGLLLIPILLAHKRLVLLTRVRIISIIIATVAAGLMTLICAGILSGPQHEAALYPFLGGIFIVYGLVVSVLAVL